MDALSKQQIAFNDLSVFAVPGFDQLGNHTTLSLTSQQQHGYFVQPRTEDFANRYASLQPAGVDVRGAMVFDLPVCDIDRPGLILQQQQGITCPERFDGQDVDKCIFLLKVLCGCPSLALLNEKGLPYGTGGDKGPCGIV